MVSDAEQEQQAISELRKAVRQREQRCVEALLKLYAFRPQDAAASDLPLLDGRWGDDLFNPETLKQLGVRVGGGIAAGAAAGAGVDLLVGGLTLGAAALAGAIAGGALQTARSYGSRLLGKIKGQRELTVDDSVLRLLALRQRQLLQALNAARACGDGQHSGRHAPGQDLARRQTARGPEQGPGASAVVVAQSACEVESGGAAGAG